MATLYKEQNGQLLFKEQGSLSQAIKWNEDGTFNSVVSEIPVVGCSFLVGSAIARTYADQDYWLTTIVTEILEETKEKIRFKTENSIYSFYF